MGMNVLSFELLTVILKLACSFGCVLLFIMRHSIIFTQLQLRIPFQFIRRCVC